MATFKMKCPHCGNSCEFGAALEGKRARCDQCKQPFVIAREITDAAQDTQPVVSCETPSTVKPTIDARQRFDTLPDTRPESVPTQPTLTEPTTPPATPAVAPSPIQTASELLSYDAVSMGNQCPKCGHTEPKRYYGLLHWVLIVCFFPAGLLILRRPWQRCTQCGCVYHPGWLKPVPGVRASPGDHVCWYCERIQPEDKTAITKTLYRAKQTQSVTVPRCRYCASVHQVKSHGRLIGLIPAVIVCGLTFPELTNAQSSWCCFLLLMWPATLLAGASLGGLVGQHIGRCRQVAASLEVRPLKQTDSYPGVQVLIDQGWTGAPTKAEEPPQQRPRPQQAPAWHANARDPENLYAARPPLKCPVCGCATGGATLLAVAGSAVGVVCCVCNAHGCANCCHHHNAKGKASQAIGSSNLLLGTRTVYANLDWRHNQCCGCGYKPSLFSKMLRM